MTIAATIVWEVRTTGSQTNGGGWKPGASGEDFSQQDAAQYALTTVTSGEATATMTHASAAADMVGNICRVVSGTNATLGWYEIISVNVGVDITVDRNWCTGACNNGAVNVGGAFKIGGLLDDDFFDAHQPGNTIYVASTAGGVTYTTGESILAAVAGTAALPVTWIGYNDTRATIPYGADRPTIAAGTSSFSFGTYRLVSNFIFTTSQAAGITMGAYGTFRNCKSTNTSTTANYPAFHIDGSAINCEGISNAGYGFRSASLSQPCNCINCYAHDSQIGFLWQGVMSIISCLVDTCNTGMSMVSYNAGIVANNTIRNCITGILGTTAYLNAFVNNIISDCLTGASWNAGGGKTNTWTCNNFYNTTDNTNVTLDATNLVASNPLLGSGFVSGTDGETDATQHIFTADSAPFSGVTTSDCLLIKEAGTGATLGVYVISSVDSTSQLTIATHMGASKTGITYGIVKGTDFTLGAGSPCFNTGLKPSSNIGIS